MSAVPIFFFITHQWTSATQPVCRWRPDAASCRPFYAEASPFSGSPWCSSTRSGTWDRKMKSNAGKCNGNKLCKARVLNNTPSIQNCVFFLFLQRNVPSVLGLRKTRTDHCFDWAKMPPPTLLWDVFHPKVNDKMTPELNPISFLVCTCVFSAK